MKATIYRYNGVVDSTFEFSTFHISSKMTGFVTFYGESNGLFEKEQIVTTNQYFLVEAPGRDVKSEIETAYYSESDWFSVSCNIPKKKWAKCLNLTFQNDIIGFWCDGKEYLLKGQDIKIVEEGKVCL